MKGRKVRYYLKDSFLHNQHEKNAGSKARNDVEAILISEGYKGLEIKVDNWYQMNFFKAQQHKYSATKSVFDQLGLGDELVIQFPIIHHTFLIAQLIKQAQKRGAKFYLLIHDIETLRHAAGSEVKLRHKLRNYFQEKKAMMSVDGIIVHNDIMKGVLANQGFPVDKMVSLEIFDYWKQSALSHFVLENGCGIAVESLHDLKETIDNLSDTDYQDLVDNAKRVGQEIRDGHYLKTALTHLK